MVKLKYIIKYLKLGLLINYLFLLKYKNYSKVFLISATF